MEQRQTGSQRFPHYQRHIGVSRFLLAATMVLAIYPCRLAAQAFEVASIRENPGPWHVLVGYSSSGTRLMLEGWRVSNLIEEAFHLKRYEFTTPPSSNDIVYNIDAKAEGSRILSRDEFRPLLQKLLADRFDLKFHREMRELPVYALVVGKNGPKFKESDPEKPSRSYHGVNGRNQYADLTQATMESLADGIDVDRPVINKTGLTGKYDIRLEATPEFRINNNPQPDDLRIFDAIEQQLGLKLEPQKASIEVLVVDHIGKPSAN